MNLMCKFYAATKSDITNLIFTFIFTLSHLQVSIRLIPKKKEFEGSFKIF